MVEILDANTAHAIASKIDEKKDSEEFNDRIDFIMQAIKNNANNGQFSVYPQIKQCNEKTLSNIIKLLEEKGYRAKVNRYTVYHAGLIPLYISWSKIC